MSLHSTVLCVKEAQEICFKFDHMGVLNPMDSVTKLKLVATNCDKKKDLVVWC